METLLLPANTPGAGERAAALLAAGELVALPTETVYGLAADASQAHAVAAVFQVKERPFFDPLIVHLPDLAWLGRMTSLPAGQAGLVHRLAESFWPGPLTMLLPRNPLAVPEIVTSGSALVAVRISAHPVFRRVIEAFGRPLAAPSANRFGRISPTTGSDVVSELGGRIPLILDAGATTHGLESTIVAPSSDGGSLSILRPGPVTAEMLGKLALITSPSSPPTPSAPGQLPGHYAPLTGLTLGTWRAATHGEFAGRESRIGFLGYRRDEAAADGIFGAVEYLSERGDLREAAANLFAAMRRLDRAGLESIVAEPVPETGLGRAIMDRLRRAAAGSGPGSALPRLGDELP